MLFFSFIILKFFYFFFSLLNIMLFFLLYHDIVIKFIYRRNFFPRMLLHSEIYFALYISALLEAPHATPLVAIFTIAHGLFITVTNVRQTRFVAGAQLLLDGKYISI